MKTRYCIFLSVLALGLFGCRKDGQPEIKSNEGDQQKLMALLLPAVQKIRPRCEWEPAGNGLDQSRITLPDEEYAHMHKTLGAPDIRIFLQGDTAKNGRSLPYTRLLPGSNTRIVYYQSQNDYHPRRYQLNNAWPNKVAYFYQSTGSPTGSVVPVESISINFTNVKL